MRVVERLLDDDIDPADRVDHRREPGEIDLGVGVDRDPEEGADRLLERADAAMWEVGRVRVRPAHQRVDLRSEDVAVAERDAGEVARDRDHRHGPPDRIERHDDQGVGERLGPTRGRVDPDQEDVQPLPVEGRRSARNRTGGRSGKDLAEHRLGRRAVAPGERVRKDGGRQEGREPDRAQPAGPQRIAPIEEGVQHRDRPPDENHDVEDEQGAEHRGGDDLREDHRRPVRVADEPCGENDRERRDAEQEGRAEAAVEELAGAGQQR